METRFGCDNVARALQRVTRSQDLCACSCDLRRVKLHTLGWLIQTDSAQMMQPGGGFKVFELVASHSQRLANCDREIGNTRRVPGPYEVAQLGRDSKSLYGLPERPARSIKQLERIPRGDEGNEEQGRTPKPESALASQASVSDRHEYSTRHNCQVSPARSELGPTMISNERN